MNAPFRLAGIHHVACRCKDAKEAVEFYERVLGMRLLAATANLEVQGIAVPGPNAEVQ